VFSTLVFLEQQTFANHWFATATPSFLIKLLRQRQATPFDLEVLNADSKLLDRAVVNNIDVFSVLFQTGYLTIKRSYMGPNGREHDKKPTTTRWSTCLLLKLLGFTIHAEPLTSLGRINAVLDLPEAVYITEFKVQSNQENAQTAWQQIRDKQRDAPYSSAGKPIILLGIAFAPIGRTISDWAMEAL
jgi:hypothetical protein